ncbi:MAG: toxin-antitoxin system HicB family antitoxin [Candidatus Latescibacteria bacterium]|nr:toxin-antitoxin system HicB family antitoxin [Candidatus Latescibacterota bacterium]
MNKINAVLVRMPADLKRRLQTQAQRQRVSVNQLITYSLTRQIATLEAFSYLEQRLEGKSARKIREDFDRVLRKVKNSEVPKWDQI